MNHIYKVIWNKAKHCYTVVSEIAKSHSDSTKRVRMGTTAALMAVAVLTGFTMPAQAAVTIEKDGTVKANAADISALNNLLANGVTAAKDGSVAIGGLTVKKNGEVSVSSPDVVYGKNAKINWDSNNTTGQISIGNNAMVVPGHGRQEEAFAYDGNYDHAAGAIAIGTNTYARTGSIMIGSHVYKGNMGDVKNIDTDTFNTDSNGAYGFTVNSTTIGTNSFTRGNLATTIGDYNIQSGKSRGYSWSSLFYGAQNFGATVIGALNSNESQSSGSGTSGVANSIVGVANKVNSSNGTLVFGAGNEVTNSLSYVSVAGDSTSLRDAKKAQDALKNAVAESDAGGAVLAIGGANKADWAQKSQLVGVGNTLTGTSNAVSKYDMINGYKNEVTNATHTSIIGSNNKAKDVQATTVMGDNNDLTGNGNHVIGDNHKVTGKNNILIGNNKEQKTHSGSDSVIIGNNASAGNGSMVMGNQAHAGNTGIALGMNASAGDGQNLAIGYYANVSGAKNSTALGYASKVEKRDILSSDGNDGVVSVGKSVGQSGEAGITRRIINVKAGVNDTDAVNVSQLKGVETIANKGWNLTTGVVTDATQVKPGDTVDFSGDKNISVSHNGTDVSIALKDTLTLGSNATDGYVTVDGVKGTVWAGHAVSAGNVNMDGDSGEITGLTNTTLNSKDFATTGRAATEEQLKLVKNQADSAATEASKHSKVVNGSNITVEETDQDGQKTYKVGLNKDILLGDITGKNVSISGTMGTIETTGYIATKDLIIADKGAQLADITVSGNAISNGEAKVALDGAAGTAGMINGKGASIYMQDGYTVINSKVAFDQNGKISGVAAGAITADSTDAVNGSQLHAVATEAGKHSKVVNGSNINVEETDVDGQKIYKVGLNDDILLGKLTGNNVSISGTKGTIETTGYIATKDKIYADMGAKLADVNVTGDTISNDKSSVKLDKDGTVTINNKVTVDQNGKVSGVAAGDISDTSTDAVNGSQLKATNDRVSQVEGDITNIKSDITDIKGDVKNLGDRVTKVEQEAGKHTKVVNGSNVTVEETDQDGQKTYKVGLNKDLLLGDITGKNVSISGTNGTIETTGYIATKDKIYADKGAKLADIDITGDTISNGQSSVKLDKEGTVTINGKVSVNQDGKVSGVAAGDISEKSTDAINGSQLFETKQQVTQNAQSISKLGNRINKVGAGAAALAALHPLDFDPDDKWDIAAGYGNYNGENAAAIGAYYRPNEDTMFSVGGSFGNGENMVNAGVSLKLGQGNHVSTSKVAMAKEIKDLRKELEGLKSALLDVNAGKKLDTSKLQLFPDVPKNHWAYEYVSALKGNGMLTGYPDGEFKGDRPMTRYEFATMLYKAMLEGATLSDKILKEFAPELERFTVDTVHQDKDGKPTVERVRTVKAEK